jgi:hypothetical protein
MPSKKRQKSIDFTCNFPLFLLFFSQNSIKKAQKKQLVTRLFEQFLMFEGLE